MVETLSEARASAGLTQQEMAEELGVSVVTYRRIEKSPEKATIQQAKRICQLLSKNYERIFFGEDAS